MHLKESLGSVCTNIVMPIFPTVCICAISTCLIQKEEGEEKQNWHLICEQEIGRKKEIETEILTLPETFDVSLVNKDIHFSK